MKHANNSGIDELSELVDDSIPKSPVGDVVSVDNDAFMERFRRYVEYFERTGDSIPCLHEEMEKSLPPNQRGGPHMIACPCPRCNPRC